MTEKSPVFEKIVGDYLLQIAALKAKEKIAKSLEIDVINDGYRIPFFHRTYMIETDRIVDADGKTATHLVSVVLCKYLLLCPNLPSNDIDLVTYKDFKDAAPFVGGFRNTVEKPFARNFEHGLHKLEKRCLELGGQSFDTEVSCQLAFKFNALPKVPVVLLFNDADEDFPAQVTFLLQKNASSYLDMECLAMIGGALAYNLQEKKI
jgi:hypothetical protein